MVTGQTSHEAGLCPKFSIIVPAYNCGKFIAKALDSLINQDIPQRNYEIIITDDGSTDETAAICDTYAENFPFIHVTHTENFGPSHARNVALPQCRGEYITFCDADDYVSPHTLSVLTTAAQALDNPDILSWRFFLNDPPEGWLEYPSQQEILADSQTTEGPEFMSRILTTLGGYLWSKAVRRDKADGIFFDEDIFLCEDELWFARIVSSASQLRVCYLNCYLYSYTRLPDFGICNTVQKTPDDYGMHKIIPSRLRMAAIANLPEAAARIIRGRLYADAVNNLRSVRWISENARSTLRECLSKYYPDFYFGSSFTLKTKLKTFIKHVLLILRIHKTRR